MKQTNFKNERWWKWLILPALALLTFACTEVGAKYPAWVEKYYAQGLYPFLAKLLSGISSLAPFSLDDQFYVLLIALPFALFFFVLMRKISLKYAGKFILNSVALIYILFYILWGFNYFRPGLTERLGFVEAETDPEKFIEVLTQLIDTTNKLQCSFETSTSTQVDRLIENSYETLAPVLNIDYPQGKRHDKKITFSGFYAKTGISGYFGPFFNEVHVNKKVLPIEYPFVLAHEKAHQLGVTSEAEANFYSWLVCTNSSSQQVQYSGNLFILYHFLLQAYELENYKQILAQISPKVKTDFKTIRQHWKELRNEAFDKTASAVNDAYLKTNKIKAGINDYHGVVEHVMNFSLDSAFQEKHHLVVN